MIEFGRNMRTGVEVPGFVDMEGWLHEVKIYFPGDSIPPSEYHHHIVDFPNTTLGRSMKAEVQMSS
jgi:hypothetical protein